VCTSNRGHIDLIGAATNTIAETFQLKPSNGLLVGLAISPDGSTAYATDAENNLLFEVSLTGQAPQIGIAVGMYPLGVAITPDGSQA
jgi:DNA-binding beta-propeller fold protein YncE